MPPKRPKAKEAKAPYHARRRPAMARTPSGVILRWSDIESATEPIVLEKDGQPAAVVIKYADYRRMDAARAERRETAWRELDMLLAQVHARTQDFTPEEIEADITAAQSELTQKHACHPERSEGSVRWVVEDSSLRSE